MSRYNVYPQILQHGGVDEQEALDWAAGFEFGEHDTQVQDIKYAEYVDTVNGIGVYYDYGADYYFFTDDEEDIH